MLLRTCRTSPVARSFWVHTFGCQMNVHDSERMSEVLASHGLYARHGARGGGPRRLQYMQRAGEGGAEAPERAGEARAAEEETARDGPRGRRVRRAAGGGEAPRADRAPRPRHRSGQPGRAPRPGARADGRRASAGEDGVRPRRAAVPCCHTGAREGAGQRVRDDDEGVRRALLVLRRSVYARAGAVPPRRRNRRRGHALGGRRDAGGDAPRADGGQLPRSRAPSPRLRRSRRVAVPASPARDRPRRPPPRPPPLHEPPSAPRHRLARRRARGARCPRPPCAHAGAVGERPDAKADDSPLHPRRVRRAHRAPPRRARRDDALHRRHRRLLGRDRKTISSRRCRSSARSASPRSSASSTRRARSPPR